MEKQITVYGGIAFDTDKATLDEAYGQLLDACEKAGVYLYAESITLYDEDGIEIESQDC